MSAAALRPSIPAVSHRQGGASERREIPSSLGLWLTFHVVFPHLSHVTAKHMFCIYLFQGSLSMS
jgi:hypothetical protein